MNPKVETFFEDLKHWRPELSKLREIILGCNLNEEFKWMHPCYTFQNANVVLIHGFKEYCAIMFFKGALLKDDENILIQQTENVQSGRQIRFTSLQQIIEKQDILMSYIFEAVEVEKAGLKVKLKKTEDFKISKELETKFNDNPDLKKAFEALSPGRQKAYLLYFSSAKQSATRESRIENYEKRILNGKGLNDCVCGLSKKFPSCDGSHKNLK
ncbi:YdeI/OmpD-associated family protein [Pedobacter sp. SD-b]|uniref:YdeI/OmpD-associated family protein n=1 Tax=Pedobacter segetis TaxID=2793069 RepID=A0ABS1BLW6_9SPHI|nr:DUF1801 domain-containing protein [Pedobacter segetis]MBK0383875.1 YdeI/OmpD-associated family protein [Pedobacter segetis]